MGHVVTSEGASYSSKPVQFYFTARLDDATQKEVTSGVEKIRFTGVDLNLINKYNQGNIARYL